MAEDGTERALTVTELSRRIRSVLEADFSAVRVEGEISNCRPSAVGHVYFTLKDDTAQISCVLFRGAAQFSPAKPANGLSVIAFGDVSVYERRGEYQIVIRSLREQGTGSLHERFEALKRKLAGEGLFESEKKRSLPPSAATIGVVTSAYGAALRDILHVLRRRSPWLRVIVFSAAVQGGEAAGQIAVALEKAGSFPGMDAVIVARGGGSIEDLWPFNEEIVARAIAACPVPVISGVGHETDFTIADFVADLRAPTPSVAAELIAPDAVGIRQRLGELREILDRHISRRLRLVEMDWDQAERALARVSPDRRLGEITRRLVELGGRFQAAADFHLERQEGILKWREAELRGRHPGQAIRSLEGKLDALQPLLDGILDRGLQRAAEKVGRKAELLGALNPQSVLARGFSITTRENGVPVRNADEVSAGDILVTTLAKGKLRSSVVDFDPGRIEKSR